MLPDIVAATLTQGEDVLQLFFYFGIDATAAQYIPLS